MPLYAVFDANNFFVSCERVFNPALWNRPTVVLSNNDGCVVSRSNEAKALGIPMAAPAYQLKELFAQANVAALSGNYALYADMSRRIAHIIHQFFPEVEEYSIDESFVFFPYAEAAQEKEVFTKCVSVRQAIYKWTRVPVSVGISHSKTLAKVAVKMAKKTELGVVSIYTEAERIAALQTFPVGDIWGVGRALSRKLPVLGISTALQLASQDPINFKKRFSVSMAKTIRELRGELCYEHDETPQYAKSTMVTESFKHELVTEEEVEHKLLEFTIRAAKHLRERKVVAGGMLLFVRGNKHRLDQPYFIRHKLITFRPATAYTPELAQFVSQSMKYLYQEGVGIKRAGVYLFDLCPASTRQLSLFEGGDEQRKKSDTLMQTMDKINRKWGSCTVSLGSLPPGQVHIRKGAKVSNQFTTVWSSLLTIKI